MNINFLKTIVLTIALMANSTVSARSIKLSAEQKLVRASNRVFSDKLDKGFVAEPKDANLIYSSFNILSALQLLFLVIDAACVVSRTVFVVL